LSSRDVVSPSGAAVRSWGRLASILALAGGPVAVALATEGGTGSRPGRLLLLAGLVSVLAAGAALALRRGEARTTAARATLAADNARLRHEATAGAAALARALERERATAEILQVINRSRGAPAPVFDAILTSAMRLCETPVGLLFAYDGAFRVVAHHGAPAAFVDRRLAPHQFGPHTAIMRAVRERRPVHIVDVVADRAYAEGDPARLETAQLLEARTGVWVPLLKDDAAVGVLVFWRREVRAFTDAQIELLGTFAAQAVIALENARVLEELEARNRELTEALEQQTATAEILRVIARSPTDLQPVMDAVAASAARLCGAADAVVRQIEGEMLRAVAVYGRGGADTVPLPLRRSVPSARAVLDRTPVQVEDIQAAWASEFPDVPPAVIAAGFRTLLAVPLLRAGAAIGVITIRRREVSPFSAAQIALLQVFADQAVIAIENVRAFEELAVRNRELSQALEQQTATAEILRVISSSPTDLQPVFDAIARSATTLCEADLSGLYTFDGTLIHVAALHGRTPEEIGAVHRAFPQRPSRLSVTARAILTAAAVQVPDQSEDPEVADSLRIYRTVLAVPMIADGRPIGAISVARRVARPFTDGQIALLGTFADQAVIAIENVRLFRELQDRTTRLTRSVEELQALAEVGRAVSSTLDLPTVLSTIAARAVQLSGTSGGVIYEYDEARQEFDLRASYRAEEELVEVLRARPIRLGEGATGQAALRRTPVEIPDTLDDRQGQVSQLARATLVRLGYRSILGLPLLLEHRIVGALTVWRREPGHFPPETLQLLQTFATQSTIAIHNARLFREVEAKGRELEIASRHKSQFLANMSHELRTPLNAILGYTELLSDGIYGELPPKIGEVMGRIDRSGKHLLGLINDVLDLSKIEAGQLELALAEYSLQEIVHAVVTQVESLAAEKGLRLTVTVARDLPAGRGDERRLAQVLLNLVGNAIKFTESGEVRIAASEAGDAFVVSVSDTGPGIAPADQQRIFEEFQQADSSSTRRKGGTGLGLSIARRIVELHGGRLWVESSVGQGSTFTLQVPMRVERQVARG